MFFTFRLLRKVLCYHSHFQWMDLIYRWNCRTSAEKEFHWKFEVFDDWIYSKDFHRVNVESNWRKRNWRISFENIFEVPFDGEQQVRFLNRYVHKRDISLAVRYLPNEIWDQSVLVLFSFRSRQNHLLLEEFFVIFLLFSLVFVDQSVNNHRLMQLYHRNYHHPNR